MPNALPSLSPNASPSLSPGSSPSSSPSQRVPSARVRDARRRFFDGGDTAVADWDPVISRSWVRSRAFGLQPAGRTPGAPHASAAQLARAIDQQHGLMAHARPVMEFVFEQTRETDSVVILADARGMLLHALGDPDFVDRAERVALRPGASWHEQWRGTNAIGTALTEGAPVVVHAAEHYLERNAFLTCTAAPIFDPSGRLLGALDISGDHRGYHRHTLALVRSAVRMIEHRLFDTRHDNGTRLRLHARPEGIGTIAEALLALSDDGWVIGANANALALFGLARSDLGATRIDRLLATDLESIHAAARRSRGAPLPVQRIDGTSLWARLECPRAVAVPAAVPAAPAPRDALDALDTGDPAMASAIGRARRVKDKPIALLLLGESGVGKELFARAFHASSARPDAPFVAVNCAALPESLIEAELFGYRPGAFTGAARDGAPGRIREAHGGTLMLDEIGDMPAQLQARLLRVLQERQVTPLGGGKPVPVDFRLICATHRNLRTEIAAGRFREDLYYRLNGLSLQLPPLRERSDFAVLVRSMLRSLLPGRDVGLAPEPAHAMSTYRWPGNLRQLDSALRTATALLGDDETVIDWPHLPDDLVEDLRATTTAVAASVDSDADASSDLRQLSDRAVRDAVDRCDGNMTHAARLLGISRNTLYRKLGALGLR